MIEGFNEVSMKKTICLILLFTFNVHADGLFADGFRPSNLGDAFRHIQGRIQSAHSGGSQADLSALKGFSVEDYERLYMYELNDEEAKRLDPRREVAKEWYEVLEAAKDANISESYKGEIVDFAQTRFKTLARRVFKGLHYDRYLKRDACLISCRNEDDRRDMACFSSEIDSREVCEEKSFMNPSKYVCQYEATNISEQCFDDSSWGYQVCQAACY